MGRRQHRLTAAAIAALALLASPAAALEPCAQDIIQIRTGDAVARFHVEIADTPQERSQGLMHRQSLPPDEGMLFNFGRERPVAFWMKNTLIPLDMIFFDAEGVVIGVEREAEPHSLEARRSPGPVLAVLEIIGGEAERRGIGAGAEARHPIFDGPDAAWPCADAE